MKHFHDVTITPAHLPAAPLIYKFKVDKGLITWCGAYFPPGCHGVVRVKIYFQTHQILPRNQEGWMHGNAGWWQGFLYFPVTAEPLTIRVEAWSYDTPKDKASGYSHTITIGLELTPFSMVPAWDRLIGVLTKIAQMIGVPTQRAVVSEATP